MVVQWLAIGAIVLATVARFLARPDAPLWLDEAGTGAIVDQPSFQQFWRMAYSDPNAPSYYVFMYAWRAFFGLSDHALRFPSVVFGALLPFAIYLPRIRGLTRTDRLMWAALLALWIPGIGYSQTARCYALLLLFATLQTVAFAQVMQRPSLPRAMIWIATASLSILTHYDAAYLGLAQGLTYLATKRWAAVKTWPAALLLLPAAALALPQAIESSRYLRDDTVWFRKLHPFELLSILDYIAGSWALALLPLGAAAYLLGRRGADADISDRDGNLSRVALASLSGAAVVVAVGFIEPSFALRYLAPFAPGVMLGMVLAVRSLAGTAKASGYMALLALAFAASLSWFAQGAHHEDSVIEALNFEGASQALLQAGTKKLVFLWDNPAARVVHPELMKAFGGFFFRRAGIPIDVVPIQIGMHEDPNLRLLSVARPTGASILWLSDGWVQGTAANHHPARISAIDPAYGCKDFGEGRIGVIACSLNPTQPVGP